MPRTIPLTLFIAVLAAPILAEDAEQVPANGFCVVNASTVAHVFSTETREGARQVVELAPGGRLCAAGTQAKDGVIGVFESLVALEGCARIVARGEVDRLIEFAEFDRCRWGSHE